MLIAAVTAALLASSVVQDGGWGCGRTITHKDDRLTGVWLQEADGRINLIGWEQRWNRRDDQAQLMVLNDCSQSLAGHTECEHYVTYIIAKDAGPGVAPPLTVRLEADDAEELFRIEDGGDEETRWILNYRAVLSELRAGQGSGLHRAILSGHPVTATVRNDAGDLIMSHTIAVPSDWSDQAHAYLRPLIADRLRNGECPNEAMPDRW